MEQNLIIIFSAAILIAAIIWWFFSKRNLEAVPARQEAGKQIAEITVDGGYIPNVIELKKGVPAEIKFYRKDRSACFDEVILPDFQQKADLPINQTHTFRITPDKTGEFTYSCGMHMFFGKVIVK